MGRNLSENTQETLEPMKLAPLLTSASLTLLAAFSSPLRADVILDWNAQMIDAIRADNSGPGLSARNLAILHTAIYDAINSVTRAGQPYAFQPDAPADTSVEAAATGAALAVMKKLYQPFNAISEERFQIWRASQPSNAALTNGLSLGTQIGEMAVQSRVADGSTTEEPYIPSEAPGQWRRTAPFFRPPLTPHWRHVEPFCLPDIEPFVPPPPPPLDSSEYARDLNEVKAIGGTKSSIRTEEQALIARFWSDFSYTSMPPGHWHLLAAVIARNENNTLEENARLFALLSLAQADAAIVCWEAKYRYNTWRPITAIQRADEDGNPETEADKTWNHLLAAPNFPSYTSGHSTFSKASSEVLTAFYGRDDLTFTVGADALPGVFRTFHSLAACADEVGMSRIYGGIHYKHDNEEGKISGGKIGRFVASNFLLSNQALPAVQLEGFEEGSPVLRAHGHIGRAWTLECSSDLVRWQTVSSGAAAIGGVTVKDTSAPSHRFYRIREEAAP